MTSHQPPQRIISHRQTVKAKKERELDLDLDGDGLTEREERKYGLNPLSPDSDGDGRYDGQEIGQGSNPRTDTQIVLNHPQLSYAGLYQQIAGEEWLGRALDERVILIALQAGHSLRETKCLIAQSPYVQGQLSQGTWDKDSAIHYIDELTAPYQPNRKQEEELSE